MGHIYYVMGKSASGKDTIYQIIKERYPEFNTVILYTTRPIRAGERHGREYFFTNEKKLDALREKQRVIEERTYGTVYGPWIYFTVDDGQFDLKHRDYLMIGTLESYLKMKEHFGEDALVPLYIHVEDGLRLARALERERRQREPKYRELCRRYLADDRDFGDANLLKCGIRKWYENIDLEACVQEIMTDIDCCG